MMAYRAVEPFYRDTRFANPQSQFRSTLLCPPSIYLSIHDLHSQQQQQSSEQQSSGLAWPRGRYPVRECRTFAIRNGFHANLNITLSPTPNYHTIFKFYHLELDFSFTHTPLVDYIAAAAVTDGDNNNSNSYLYHAHLNSATK